MQLEKTPGAPVATFRKTSLAAFALLMMLVPVVGMLAAALASKTVASGIFFVAIIVTILAYVLWLLASSAVRIDREGVIVDNFLLRHIIPWQQLDGIRIGYGLEIHLHDGTKIGSVMYGGSLLGALTGNRVATQACARMNAKRKEILSNGIPPEGNEAYRRVIHFSPWPPLIILAVLEGIASLGFFG